MLYLAYDAEMEGREKQPASRAAPAPDGSPDTKNQLDVALESLVESLEDLNVSLARAYIESIERRRAAASEAQNSN